MHVPFALPSLPVQEGARRLALALLEDAQAARGRVAGNSDPEALHDYRVALRRLRSCLRTYRRQLRSTVTGKTVRRLRRLARGTSQSRDLEVHLAWLGEQLDRVQPAERPGVSWMIERLSAARSRAWDEMLTLDESLFPRVHDRLVAQLSKFRTTVRLDADPRLRSTAVLTARRARTASERLERRLRRIRGYSCEVEIHRARIAAKHLRYLLEPFAIGLPEGDSVTDQLKTLQSAYGDVHDAHLFVAELRAALPQAEHALSSGPDVVPGLMALMASLRARGIQAFDAASVAWLEDRAGPFFRQVDALADAIASLTQLGRAAEPESLAVGEIAEDPAYVNAGLGSDGAFRRG